MSSQPCSFFCKNDSHHQQEIGKTSELQARFYYTEQSSLQDSDGIYQFTAKLHEQRSAADTMRSSVDSKELGHRARMPGNWQFIY